MAEFQRAAWGAKPPKHVGPALVREPYGAVHDIGGGDPYPSNVVATLQQIQNTELHGEYVDIAYNWGVDKDGNQWELRGDVSDGATKGYAGKSFSVLAICNASAPNWKPTPALIAGIAACFRNAQARGVLAKDAHIDGHHWYDQHVTTSPTACPGGLEENVPEIRTLVYQITPKPPAPQPSLGLEDEPMLVEVAGNPLTAPFKGVRVDFAAKKIVPHGGAKLEPDQSSINLPDDWMGGKEYAPGQFYVALAKNQKYHFTVS